MSATWGTVGSPRRTVDLSPLNKHCVREVHTNKSPFELARGVPAQTWRTVTDAWNGFHSIPLRKEDQHLTTSLLWVVFDIYVLHRAMYLVEMGTIGDLIPYCPIVRGVNSV